MWRRDRWGQCPLGLSTHHCNNFVQWLPPKPPSKACLRFGSSIEVRVFSLFKCFVPFNVKKAWYSLTILLLSHSKLMWTDKLLFVSCFSISYRTGVDVLNVSWISELWIRLFYDAEATEVVYEVRLLGTFRKMAFIINSFSIQRKVYRPKVVASYRVVQNISFGILTERSPLLSKNSALLTTLSDCIIQNHSLFGVFPSHIIPAHIATVFFSKFILLSLSHILLGLVNSALRFWNQAIYELTITICVTCQDHLSSLSLLS
jgi:hypothetical protein